MPDTRHILITGASSGIGAALARLYAQPGVTLSLSGRNVERIEGVAADCAARGADVEGVALDVVDAAAMAQWVLRRDETLPIDLVIANAGIGGATAVATQAGESADDARLILDVNMLGVLNTLIPLLPALVRRGRGQIAIVSSMAGFLGLPHTPVYSASKAAAGIYGDALRRLLMPSGVRVSVVYPGYVETPMSDSLPFARPFLWSVEKAARHIARELERGRRRIIFPRRLHLVIRFARLLPERWLDAILARRAARDLDREGR
jgi:short-subunit dehydrogenase